MLDFLEMQSYITLARQNFNNSIMTFTLTIRLAVSESDADGLPTCDPLRMIRCLDANQRRVALRPPAPLEVEHIMNYILSASLLEPC